MYTPRAHQRPEIYGIIGKKGHGKDTFANLVKAAAPNFAIEHFAEVLKSAAQTVFGIEPRFFYDPALKEHPFTQPIHMDGYLTAMSNATGVRLKSAGLIASSPRELLQFFGTNYVRVIEDLYWVNRLTGKLKNRRRVLVPDTRFINEVEALRAVGGLIVKIHRIDVGASNDTHASEMEAESVTPDLILGVRTGDLSLPKRVAQLLAYNKFSNALKYDYRRVEPAIAAYLSGQSAEACSQMLGESKSAITFYNLLSYYGHAKRGTPNAHKPYTTLDGKTLKHCAGCDTEKELACFSVSVKSWDTLYPYCKACASKRHKDAYVKHRAVNSFLPMFNVWKRMAPRRGLSFELTLQDLEQLWSDQKGLCAYSGRALSWTLNDPDKVSLDRIDSKRGYERGNVVLCTVRTNLMKRDMSREEFLSVVAQIHRHNQ